MLNTIVSKWSEFIAYTGTTQDAPLVGGQCPVSNKTLSVLWAGKDPGMAFQFQDGEVRKLKVSLCNPLILSEEGRKELFGKASHARVVEVVEENNKKTENPFDAVIFLDTVDGMEVSDVIAVFGKIKEDGQPSVDHAVKVFAKTTFDEKLDDWVSDPDFYKEESKVISQTCSDKLNKPWLDDSLAANGCLVHENFSDWFKSGGIKNTEGEPIVVYRGDKNPPDSFGRSERREHGLFFAEEQERAQYYGEVRAYVLKAENILDLRETYGQWFKGGVVKDIVDELYQRHYEGEHSNETGEPYDVGDVINAIEGGYLWKMDGTGGFSMRAWRDLQHIVQANGFDALVVADDGEGWGVGVDWVVFNPEQVKCVSHHSGLFLKDSNSVTDAPSAEQMIKNDLDTTLKRAKEAMDFVGAINQNNSTNLKILI